MPPSTSPTRPAPSATTGGAVTVTDGPFAETAEALGGYYVLEADNLDDVIEMVRHIPATSTPRGASEIRPLVMHQSSIQDEADLRRHAGSPRCTGPRRAADVPGTPEWEAGAAAHGAFAAAAGDAILEGGAVQPAATATTVRVRDGEVVRLRRPLLGGDRGGRRLLRPEGHGR